MSKGNKAGEAPPVHKGEGPEFQKRPSLADVMGAPKPNVGGGQDEKHAKIGSKGFANK